jgi:hypothetical protein
MWLFFNINSKQIARVGCTKALMKAIRLFRGGNLLWHPGRFNAYRSFQSTATYLISIKQRPFITGHFYTLQLSVFNIGKRYSFKTGAGHISQRKSIQRLVRVNSGAFHQHRCIFDLSINSLNACTSPFHQHRCIFDPYVGKMEIL